MAPITIETRARVVWDAQAFYVGFDAADVDINARFEQRDDPTCMEQTATCRLLIKQSSFS